jgi:formate-dependent nitrite reductase membrane component NrfD
MTVCLAVLLAALRIGLKMRARRLAGARPPVGSIRLHVRLAKPAVLFAMLGFIGGALSSSLIRNWTLFGSFHAVLGVIVVCLFAATGYLGLRAERGEGDPEVHGLLGVLAMLGALLAAIAGFVLLP